MKIHVTEEIIINSKSNEVFPLIKNFNQWPQWSPWICLDPKAKVEFKEKTEYGYKKMSWKGKVIGSGEITCRQYTEKKINYDLVFLSPYKSKAKTEIEIIQQDQKTKIKWSLNSNLPFFLFFLKDVFKKMLSKDYKRGLKRLKAICENKPIAKLEFFDIPEIINEFSFSGVSGKNIKFENIGVFMKEKFELVGKEFSTQNIEKKEGYTFCDKVKFGKDLFDFTCGYSCDKKANLNILTKKDIPKHKSIKVKLSGSYDYLEDAWSGLMKHARALKLKANKSVAPYEKYINNPENQNECITEIHFPIK